MNHTQKWRPVCPRLRRVQEKARANAREKFTSLAHLIDDEALRRSYHGLNASATAGIDGQTKAKYGENLEENLKELHERMISGRYRASPVRRQWIEKPGGGERPLGIPTTEDKIVQGAVVEILNSIYETDFLGFSYGSRPGRSAHQALQALQTVLQKGKVNWVVDADISKFFDSIGHKELMKAIQRRVIDRSLLRLIGKWLKAGAVEEDGRRICGKQGTPQGGVISPLLANIFLHYVVDEYVHDWRKTRARGEVYIVRYMDDFVIACQEERDARELLEGLTLQLELHGLKLNSEKTRLIRYGSRWNSGKGEKSETFNFLGLTHIAGKDKAGRHCIKRKTASERLNRRLKSIGLWCRKERHKPIPWQYAQLNLKLRGHYNYYGVRGNFEALKKFRHGVWRSWFNTLKRRSQKVNVHRLYTQLKTVFVLKTPWITHPEGWLSVNPGYLLGRAGCGNAARPVL